MPSHDKPGVIKTIRIDQIAVYKELQYRANGTDEAWVAELSQHLKNGGSFNSLPVVFKPKKGKFILGGGFHRLAAYKACGFSEIEAEVREGELRQAKLYALGDNADHGMRRTREDTRKAAVEALNDAELSQLSARELAKIVKCDPAWLARVKREITGQEPLPEKAKGGKASSIAQGRGLDTGDEDDTEAAGGDAADPHRDTSSNVNDLSPARDEMGRAIPGELLLAYSDDPEAFAVCPHWIDGESHNPKCSDCGGKGYVTSTEFRQLPQVVADTAWKIEDPIERALRFRSDFDEAITYVRKLARLVDKIATTPGGYFLRNSHSSDGVPHVRPVAVSNGAERYQNAALLSLLRLLKSARPKCRCTAIADPTASHADCRYCAGQGWAPESAIVGTNPQTMQLELMEVDPWGVE